ncbi:MAG: hypothetical protein IJM87_00040 [Ruminococcus sp.]|nr:hypothetical protein [Ruminococcus sp.]
MNKLSLYQLAAVMLCGHAFSLMTFFPYTCDNPAEYMIGAAIAVLIEGILLVPLFFAGEAVRQGGVFAAAERLSPVLRVIVGVFYTAVLIFFCFRVIGNFTYFLDGIIPRGFMRWTAVCGICAAGVYLGLMKPSVIGKTAGVMFFLFLVFCALVVLCSLGRHYTGSLAFHLASRNIGSGIAESVKCELLRGMDLMFLVLFLPCLKQSAAKTAAVFLSAKLVFVWLCIGFVTWVLGDYVMLAKLPFSAMASYSSTAMIERFDAAFMAVWVTLAVVRLGAAFHCLGESIRAVIKPLPKGFAVISTAAVSAGLALFRLSRFEWEKEAYDMSGWAVSVSAVALVPLVLAAGRLIKKRGEHSGEDIGAEV